VVFDTPATPPELLRRRMKGCREWLVPPTVAEVVECPVALVVQALPAQTERGAIRSDRLGVDRPFRSSGPPTAVDGPDG
jgi:hypothetical protein